MRLHALSGVGGGLLLATSIVLAAGSQPVTIPRDALAAKSYSTWEGAYAFSEDQVVGIQGQPDLHLLVFRSSGREGSLVAFAKERSGGYLQLLREPDTNVKGVTPQLEGIDVLPGANAAEVLVRWHHPGEGGLRTVEKFRYNSSGLDLVTRSDFIRDGRKMKWVVHDATVRSTPARLANPGGASPH